MSKTAEPSIGTIGGYTIRRRELLDRLDGAYLELEHDRTGARHIHIECKDDNNAFAVFFPTVPKDSTGVAHILEHVVLAGSQRYAVRDPFFSMTRRSLATFMNAMTSADWTMYPFSSRNAKDYMNLLDVYLDATFFPRLSEDSFKQEGIRFEFEDAADPKSGLRYKGVRWRRRTRPCSGPSDVRYFQVLPMPTSRGEIRRTSRISRGTICAGSTRGITTPAMRTSTPTATNRSNRRLR
jgi:hypothetical protein